MRAIGVGRMGDAVEVKELQNGNRIGNARIAVSSGWGDNATTSWFNLVVYDKKKIEALERFSEKGSRLFVDGELRIREYTTRDGDKRYATEIVIGFDGVLEILDGRKDGGNGGSQTRASERPTANYDDDLDDDVPF